MGQKRTEKWRTENWRRKKEEKSKERKKRREKKKDKIKDCALIGSSTKQKKNQETRESSRSSTLSKASCCSNFVRRSSSSTIPAPWCRLHLSFQFKSFSVTFPFFWSISCAKWKEMRKKQENREKRREKKRIFLFVRNSRSQQHLKKWKKQPKKKERWRTYLFWNTTIPHWTFQIKDFIDVECRWSKHNIWHDKETNFSTLRARRKGRKNKRKRKKNKELEKKKKKKEERTNFFSKSLRTCGRFVEGHHIIKSTQQTVWILF